MIIESRKSYTGEELAKALQLDLTESQRDECWSKNPRKFRTIKADSWSRFWRWLRPDKIFLIQFENGCGMILMADNEADAILEAVPFLTDQLHHCRNPYYQKSCPQCVTLFDELAENINKATVTWLGWGQPDYNWVISV